MKDDRYDCEAAENGDRNVARILFFCNFAPEIITNKGI